MLGRICMTLSPKDIVCAVTNESQIKVNYTKEENFGLKYGKIFMRLFMQF